MRIFVSYEDSEIIHSQRRQFRKARNTRASRLALEKIEEYTNQSAWRDWEMKQEPIRQRNAVEFREVSQKLAASRKRVEIEHAWKLVEPSEFDYSENDVCGNGARQEEHERFDALAKDRDEWLQCTKSNCDWISAETRRAQQRELDERKQAAIELDRRLEEEARAQRLREQQFSAELRRIGGCSLTKEEIEVMIDEKRQKENRKALAAKPRVHSLVCTKERDGNDTEMPARQSAQRSNFLSGKKIRFGMGHFPAPKNSGALSLERALLLAQGANAGDLSLFRVLCDFDALVNIAPPKLGLLFRKSDEFARLTKKINAQWISKTWAVRVVAKYPAWDKCSFDEAVGDLSEIESSECIIEGIQKLQERDIARNASRIRRRIVARRQFRRLGPRRKGTARSNSRTLSQSLCTWVSAIFESDLPSASYLQISEPQAADDNGLPSQVTVPFASSNRHKLQNPANAFSAFAGTTEKCQHNQILKITGAQSHGAFNKNTTPLPVSKSSRNQSARPQSARPQSSRSQSSRQKRNLESMTVSTRSSFNSRKSCRYSDQRDFGQQSGAASLAWSGSHTRTPIGERVLFAADSCLLSLF